MKHAFSPALILLCVFGAAGLAGCAAEHDADHEEYSFSSGWGQPAKTASLKPDGVTTGALPPAAAQVPDKQEKQPEAFKLSREQMQRHERRVYAQGLEKILLANGVNVSVTVYEGPAGPSPTLMFFGYFTKDFVTRALTNGAVLQRAKELGFNSVDFFDRGPDGHYQFVLSKSAPLPKCAAYQRLCL
jgi:hypothetical protein